MSSEPYVLHCPNYGKGMGSGRKEFHEIMTSIISQPVRSLQSIDDVFFITFNNKDEKSMLEKVFDSYGMKNYVVLSKNCRPWDHTCKIFPLYEFLNNNKFDENVVVVLDSRDVIFSEYPVNIVKDFQSYNCDALFCNTHHDWPSFEAARGFEDKMYKNRARYHGRLSSGGCVGYKGYLLGKLKEIMQLSDANDQRVLRRGRSAACDIGKAGRSFDDQLAWRLMHMKYYPEIMVDYKCKIFSRYDKYFGLS